MIWRFFLTINLPIADGNMRWAEQVSQRPFMTKASPAKDISMENTPLQSVLAAASTAACWHAKQRRKGTAEEPYINHL